MSLKNGGGSNGSATSDYSNLSISRVWSKYIIETVPIPDCARYAVLCEQDHHFCCI